MKLGMQVGLGSANIISYGDPGPPPQKKGGTTPPISATSVVTKRLNVSKFHLVGK